MLQISCRHILFGHNASKRQSEQKVFLKRNYKNGIDKWKMYENLKVYNIKIFVIK